MAAGTMAGLCGGVARHGSAQLSVARRSTPRQQLGTAGAGRGRGGVPLVHTGDRGAALGGPGWRHSALPPTAAVGVWGGPCSRLCSHQPPSEEAVTGGGSVLLAPS